jgi:inositol hexakisphosphate/diphosphoinositol-pentakisphosphate kinase
MSYFKLLGYNVSKKLTGSANSLFSTAVISGSSSAPNLKDMVPPHASAVAGEYRTIGLTSDIISNIQ